MNSYPSPESTVTGSSSLVKLSGVVIHVNERAWSSQPHPPSVSRNTFCIQLYHLVQATMSIVRNSEVVRSSGAAIVLHI